MSGHMLSHLSPDSWLPPGRLAAVLKGLWCQDSCGVQSLLLLLATNSQQQVLRTVHTGLQLMLLLNKMCCCLQATLDRELLLATSNTKQSSCCCIVTNAGVRSHHTLASDACAGCSTAGVTAQGGRWPSHTGDPLCRLCLSLAMALPGLRPLGHVWAQFMMVCGNTGERGR